MSKKIDSFIMLLFFSCPFALFSLWIGFICAFLLWANIDIQSDFLWDLCVYGIYYIGNAVFNLFVGIMAGYDVKKRFFGPVLTAICLLPTAIIFLYYTTFLDWFCIVTTLLVGVVAMVVSHVITRKKTAKLRVETAF